MAFGILECKKMEAVPGTAFMSDQDDLPPEFASIPREQLKHGTGRYKDMILVPQPSDSPNDPLNWSQPKKDFILLITSLSASLCGAYGPMLSPGFLVISSTLQISLLTLAQSSAWLILSIGLGLFFTNPLAKIFGRRPIYLFAITLMLITSIWGAITTSYTSFLWSRILAGIGMAPYETLIQCTIGDLYFVHERATRIAVWNLFLLTGISGGALVAGYIIEREGYRWTFGVCAIFFGVLGVLVFLFVPETAYKRDGVLPVLVGGGEKIKLGKEHEVLHVDEAGMNITESNGEREKKHSYLRSLRVFTGRYSKAPGWKPFVRPAILLFYPAVFWGFLVYGTVITWIVVFSVVNASIFVEDPYNFSVSEVGLISLSPFILTIIGEVISGPLNDWICVYLTKKNRGIYEPEFRLPLMSVSLILGVVGFYGFGATVEYKTHWFGPVFCFGLANMSLVFAATCVFGYIVDSYRELNEEAFVAINLRNLLTFGLTYFAVPWYQDQGALIVFSILGSLFVFVTLLTIPLWVFGKRFRSFTGRNEWLQRFMNDNN
ncbi:major facilitator superfamily domain-containing protein [Podospora fimiseda]|uniref:Major facilitator superfamily domain-containing protein n=1 Tax=Podospora fimiseda TaxID=252190 RepID=A0AAN7BGC0_9PEZI|nr:major facilitator superfamily domain-containing protein [Podospora fimiseda]